MLTWPGVGRVAAHIKRQFGRIFSATILSRAPKRTSLDFGPDLPTFTFVDSIQNLTGNADLVQRRIPEAFLDVAPSQRQRRHPDASRGTAAPTSRHPSRASSKQVRGAESGGTVVRPIMGLGSAVVGSNRGEDSLDCRGQDLTI